MTDSSERQPQPVIASRTRIHQGRKFDFEMLTVQRPSGKTLEREVVRHPGAIVVVPVLEQGGSRRVVLIRNFRIVVEASLVECCAGTIERPRQAGGGFAPGEDPKLCAARELIEETGYRARNLTPLTPEWFFTTPGMTDERMFAFVATGLEHVGQQLEEDETIRVLTVTPQEALRMATDGTIRDAKSMLAILLAERAGFL